MAQQKYVITVSESEKNLIINALMEVHNSLIRRGNTTIDVDTLLKRVLRAPLKKEVRCSSSEAR